MATLNISLSEQLKSFAQRESNDGGYSNASDYVRTLIREDRERKEARSKIETLLLEGVDALDMGEGLAVDKPYWEHKKARLLAQVNKT